MNLQNKKAEFLLLNPRYTQTSMAYFLPLSAKELRRYKTVLNWDAVSVNQAIPWSAEVLEEFQDVLSFDKGDEFALINTNEKLPWSIEFIENFRNSWDWEILSQNRAVIENSDIRRYFLLQLEPYLSENPEVEDDEIFDELERNLHTTNKFIEYQISTEKEIEQNTNLKFSLLSSNEYLPWSGELISKYAEKWDWDMLSLNPSLPWTIDLIEQFESKWCWGGEICDINGFTKYECGLSGNPGLPWSYNLIERFKNKFDGFTLSFNSEIKWDIEMLTEFKYLLDLQQLGYNKHLWNTVFKEFNQLEIASDILGKMSDDNDVYC
ncbi:MAG: hypothetical protein ACJ77K_19320 [Bacteroidia bacterium]